MPRGIYKHKSNQGFQNGHKVLSGWGFQKGYTPWSKGTKGIKKKTNGSFKKGHPNFLIGKIKLKTPGSFKKGHIVTETTRKKMSKTKLKSSKNKGENHWHWRGGIWNLKGDNKRNDPKYKRWVKQIKKRDKECKLKDENCDGYLVVHHIKSWAKYPKLRYELTNGITLCQAHHPRKRAEEIQMIPRLSVLVGNNV